MSQPAAKTGKKKLAGKKRTTSTVLSGGGAAKKAKLASGSGSGSADPAATACATDAKEDVLPGSVPPAMTAPPVSISAAPSAIDIKAATAPVMGVFGPRPAQPNAPGRATLGFRPTPGNPIYKEYQERWRENLQAVIRARLGQ